MTDTSDKTETSIDPEALTDIAERSQRLVGEFLNRHSSELQGAQTDATHIGEAFMEMTARLMSDPTKLFEAQMNLWQDYMSLWQATATRMMGGEAGPVIEPDKADRRFKDDAWSENAVFDYLKQSYLLTSRCLQNVVNEVEGLDDKTAQKVEFYTRQLVDAMSPSNFAFSNPEVLRATAESNGENLVKGLQNLLDDMERGDGQLRISMTDEEAFTVGENIAVTPGQVVFRNTLIELIQYTPTTDKVVKRPLLIVPPWINKFYILDLKPENSFIKWAVDQGHTVFVISWVNPGAELRDMNFEDYMFEGPLAAIDAIEQATGEKSVNAIAYCIGGTLLASTLAYMAATNDKKWKNRVASATYFTTMIDFAEAGELGVFIDEKQVADLEVKMNERGYLEGREMAQTFNMMRANDLIWSFVINNYLLGKEPFPFDLLYWNGDSTRMPACMHSYYLRNMYLENKLKDPGGLELGGEPIDVRKIKVPTYMVSTREDHIAPWMSTYAATQLFAGPVRFVLAASGHIAGVVNPPAKKKYCFWTNAKNPADPEAWFEAAKQQDGSWWPDWDKWVKKHGDGEVAAREPGKSGKLKALAPAPGTYVLAKA